MKQRIPSFDNFIKENSVAYAFMSDLGEDMMTIKIYSTEDRNEENLLDTKSFDKNDVESQQDFLDKYNTVYLK